MQTIRNGHYTGERALFMSSSLDISDTLFDDGESPLKESHDLSLANVTFGWKYPLWYCHDVRLRDCTLLPPARAGIWYTDSLSAEHLNVSAPKAFRRCRSLDLSDVIFSDASETLWYCEDITLRNVKAKGDYLCLGSRGIRASNLQLNGNYGFESCEDIEISDSVLMTKDAFWNCRNVTVRDSKISGEYIGWNSENVTFINCTIESLQGFCYMKDVVLRNCILNDTTLAFEYSTVDADVRSRIDSVKNPVSGVIRAASIGELIMEEDKVDVSATRIITEDE